MSTANESIKESNGVLYRNGNEAGLSFERSGTQVSTDRLKDICRELLIEIGEDPNRPGLKDTPRRFANYWQEFIDYNPGTISTTFESVTVDQMVCVSNIKVWSLCEHHLLPFWCDISIGYITDKKVLGLSKFARIAQKHAHKLQLQEKLVDDIAKEITNITGSRSVAVVGKGVHLCMVMRGIKSDNAIMTSSVMTGVFKEKSETRQEFLQLVN